MRELRCAPADGRSTRVVLGAPVIDGADELFDAELGERPRFVVADRGALRAFGPKPPRTDLVLDPGPALKSFATLERLLGSLADARVGRSGAVVALGGGAVGDLVGLGAALWLRGVELVTVPTTLLAMVDSSVGGKTAIDLPQGKNLVGAYWPASSVLVDTGFLATLPEVELRSGLGEVLKVAIGLDAELFALCEREREAILAAEDAVMLEVVARALAAKIRIVEADPREAGPRRLLNLGHTLGHALEAASGFRTPHGVAVARGLHHALAVARARGVLAGDAADRCRDLLSAYGFEAGPLPPRERLLAYVRADKKVEGEHVHVVLPDAIGSCRTAPMTAEEFLTI